MTKQYVTLLYPMNYMKKLIFFLRKKRKKILSLLEDIDLKIEHLGGLAIPGCLTKRDIDIQIRVDKKDFQKVCEYMESYVEIKRKDIWTLDKAIFKKDTKEFPVDYIVTVNGSESGMYYFGGRDILINNLDVLEEYNQLKRNFESKRYKEYRTAKTEFWHKILKKYFGFSKII